MINEYAKAFFELSNELKNLEDAKESFDVFNTEFNGDFKKLLLSPKITKKEKKEVISNCFKSCDSNFVNLLYVVIDNSRVDMLDDIYKDFIKLIDEMNNVMNIDVYSCEELTNEDTTTILEKLEKVYTGKKVVIKNLLDNTLIGGYKIFHDGKQIDGTIKNQFKIMKENL
ncbi:MAG: ATP synthase F1 subunit delta [bacterium]